MSDVTFIIPVAPYHAALLQRALDSVKAQTVPCEYVVIHDEASHGPSWARNRGLVKAQTPFVVFLDADDWVEPTFVQRCLDAWEPNRYVYTDWYVGDTVTRAPGNPWCDDLEWHVITALLPKYAVDEVRGFRDGPGEDTEFYWALTRRAKCCGKVLHAPLFHYGAEGQRAKSTWGLTDGVSVEALTKSPAYQQVMREIIRGYGNMGCCSDQIIKARESLPDGEAGDVMARAIWGGNRQVLGPATGRLYPRAGNGRLMPVNPQDAQMAPHLWQIVDPRVRTTPDDPQTEERLGNLPVQHTETFDDLVNAMFPGAHKPQPSLKEMQAVEPAQVQPDVRKISDLTRRAYE